MINEYYSPGTRVSQPVPPGTRSGDPVRVGPLNGVAATDIGAGGNIASHATVDYSPAIYRMEVTGQITSGGQALYLTPRDGSTAPVLSTSGSGDPWGHAIPPRDGDGRRTETSGAWLVRPAQR